MPTNMPPELSELHDQLVNSVNWMHYKWEQHRKLLADQTTVDLLNNTAPGFFRVCQDVLMDETLMGICRVTDPSSQGKRDNITLDRLVAEIDAAAEPQLKAKTVDALATLQPRLSSARNHRNRRIAHIDLQTHLGAKLEPLTDVTIREVEQALKGIADLLNAVSIHFDRQEFGFGETIDSGGADALLYWLRKGYDHRRR